MLTIEPEGATGASLGRTEGNIPNLWFIDCVAAHAAKKSGMIPFVGAR
jgi:hypothetical protein